ncbi:MAG: glucuronate isomerase [Balneolaceae bacterium]|nr:MAG: glucuronate isomerase [Balneolaceae bacterium]
MKSFIHDDFLLEGDKARRLYHSVAKDLPVIDYHNHLPPDEIAADKKFENLTEIWLKGDHYKWRAMRTCGIDEERITGKASDREKFMAWAETVPQTLRNPLFHWTHMELADPFGISDRLLNGVTAGRIWDECNEMLQDKDFSARSLLQRNRVEIVATTDDPVSDLQHHRAFSGESSAPLRMVPTFRPDTGMNIEKGDAFIEWVSKLEKVSGVEIRSLNSFWEALQQRHDAFHELGCRASDHGIEEPYSAPYSDQQVEKTFDKARSGKKLTRKESARFKSAFLYRCGVMNHQKGWVLQLHIGAQRNNNSRMLAKLGPDAGFDSMGDGEIARPLARLLDRLDRDNILPKTVLYNIHPGDNELIGTMIGNFQDGTTPGKLQHGPPWWFLDQKDGIEKQIESLSNMGILSRFIGMTTDSRSFLSFSRHHYFRRILCNLLGRDMDRGVLPDEPELISDLVESICYGNAKGYFLYSQNH